MLELLVLFMPLQWFSQDQRDELFVETVHGYYTLDNFRVTQPEEIIQSARGWVWCYEREEGDPVALVMQESAAVQFVRTATMVPVPTTAVEINECKAAIAYENQTVLTWNAATKNTDGTPITGLTGYRVEYCGSAFHATQQGLCTVGTMQTLAVTGTEYTVRDLAPGSYQFRIRTLAGSDQSTPTPAVSKTVQ